MKENTSPQKRIKVTWKYRPSPLSLKILLVVLIVFSTLTLTALNWVRQGIQAYTDELRQEVSALEYANGKLEERNAQPDSANNIADVAQEELGLVKPDTIVINPQ